MTSYLDLAREAARLSPPEFEAAFPHALFLVYAHQVARDGALRFETTRALDPASGALVSLEQPRVEWLVSRERPGAFLSMITIGRAPHNDVILEAQGVSKFHAYVLFTRGQYAIVDAGSTLGTRVGDHRLRSRDERHPLQGGEAITLGSLPLTFHTPRSLRAALRPGGP